MSRVIKKCLVGASMCMFPFLTCLPTGCSQMREITPEQVEAMRGMGQALADTAAQTGLTATAIVEFENPEFYISSGAGMRGPKIFLLMHANPASVNKTVE